MKESRFVKAKIVAGYLTLLAVLILSVGYVYRTMGRISPSDGSYAQLQHRHNLVNETLYRLYQAESYGQLMLAGYQSYERLYRRELETVRACLDSLRRMGEKDSLQTVRLKSIARLIDEKQRRTMNLRRNIRSGGTAGLLDKNIEELIRLADSIPTLAVPAPAPVAAIERDTIRVQKRKRRFLRRFADLFSPPKEDSSIVISQRVFVDTLSAGADLRDTITTVLRSLQDKVTGERIAIYEKAWDEGQRLRYSNDRVNAQIYRLISDFEQEENAYLMHRIEQNEALRRHSSRVLGGIAIGALVLMLLFVAVLWRDVSRSNRYKRALEAANRDKGALLEAREKLMLAITHDIKAPLGTIMGYLDLLSRLDGGKRAALYLRQMQGASEHLLELVNSLLDFYRLDIRKIDLRPVAFSPAQLFSEIRDGFAPAAAAKGLELRAAIAPEAARTVRGDASRIRQIADNLLSNALKFTDRGSVMLRVDRAPGRLIFRVADTGRGIGREERERIFGEFVRLRSARGVDGFGLGLSIVDRLVKLLGGQIALESRPGQGTTFIVSLPVDDAPGPACGPEPGEGERIGTGQTGNVPAEDVPAGPNIGASQSAAADSAAGEAALRENPEQETPASGNSAPEHPAPAAPDTTPPCTGNPNRSVPEHDIPERTAPNPPEHEIPTPQTAAGCGLRLLLIDDDPLQLEMTAAMCREAGIRADTCPYPEFAGRLAAEHAFDAVLTDIQMPGTDGFAVLDAIRRAHPRLPVVAVTARSENSSDDFAARGFAGHLRKPFSTGELIRTVRTVCPNRAERCAASDGVSDPSPCGAAPTAPTTAKAAGTATDFDALTRFAGDDRGAAREILRTFIGQSLENVRLLRRAAERNDPAALRATAHKMVPIFTMLGCTELARSLRRMENASEPMDDRMRRAARDAAEKVTQIVREAQKTVSLP